MSSMFVAGTVWWIVASVLGTMFQLECLYVTTTKGVALKAVAALSVVGYAITLIAMSGSVSKASTNFVIALVFVTLGDILLAYLERIGNGTSESFLMIITNESKKGHFILIVAGAFYISSYFLQTVAFVKGISHYSNVSDYVVPFLVFLLLPPLFTLIGGLLTKFVVVDADLEVFIIGVFYIFLASASFSASTVFAFALFQKDMLHSLWIFVGGVLFFLALLLVELRYSRPKNYDNIPMRVVSRLLTFVGRLMLAGCAFLL